jgi:hypothetical protein
MPKLCYRTGSMIYAVSIRLTDRAAQGPHYRLADNSLCEGLRPRTVVDRRSQKPRGDLTVEMDGEVGRPSPNSALRALRAFVVRVRCPDGVSVKPSPTQSHLVKPSPTINLPLPEGLSIHVTPSIRGTCVICGRNFCPSVRIRVPLWLSYSLGADGGPVAPSRTQSCLVVPSQTINISMKTMSETGPNRRTWRESLSFRGIWSRFSDQSGALGDDV